MFTPNDPPRPGPDADTPDSPDPSDSKTPQTQALSAPEVFTSDEDHQESEGTMTIRVDDLHTMMRVLYQWHGQKVKVLEYMLSVPPGNRVEFEGEEHALEGDLRLGFTIGLNLALIELGELPFKAEEQNPDEQSAIH